MFGRIIGGMPGQEVGTRAANDSSALVEKSQLLHCKMVGGGEPTITIFLLSISADIPKTARRNVRLKL